MHRWFTSRAPADALCFRYWFASRCTSLLLNCLQVISTTSFRTMNNEVGGQLTSSQLGWGCLNSIDRCYTLLCYTSRYTMFFCKNSHHLVGDGTPWPPEPFLSCKAVLHFAGILIRYWFASRCASLYYRCSNCEKLWTAWGSETGSQLGWSFRNRYTMGNLGIKPPYPTPSIRSLAATQHYYTHNTIRCFSVLILTIWSEMEPLTTSTVTPSVVNTESGWFPRMNSLRGPGTGLLEPALMVCNLLLVALLGVGGEGGRTPRLLKQFNSVDEYSAPILYTTIHLKVLLIIWYYA